MDNMINDKLPSTWLSETAPEKTKALWWMHGHPHSERYSRPELTTLSALIRFNASEHGDDVAFAYPETSTQDVLYHKLTWAQVEQVIVAAANHYARELASILTTANANGRQPTIALWADGHTIEYFVTQMALTFLNVRVLLLADNAPSSAVMHLVKITSATGIVADPKHARESMAIQSISMIRSLLFQNNDLCDQQPWEQCAFNDGQDGWDRHAFIIHSSGSTGLPKPITHTNRSLMQIARMYRLFPEFHVENWFLLFPLYHIAGFSIILSGLPNALVTTLPPRQWPPRPSTIIETCSVLKQMGYPVECIHTAPMVIESLVQHIESRTGDFSPLTELKVLQPGGAMLPEAMVTKLTQAGVNVKTTYGSTEIGPPFRSIPHSRQNPECYRLASLYPDDKRIAMEEIGPGLYECVVYNGFLLAAELWDSPTDTKPYRTRDLFVQEPPGSGYFRLQGRLDDVLIHTNGENTNASPIELDIKSRCRSARSLVLLGHARPCTSLLVELYNPSSPDIRELLAVIDDVNTIYPKHSTILPSMVHVLPEGTHLPITPKGSVKRKEAETMFANIIDGLYSKTSQHSMKISIPDEELESTVAEIVSKILGITTDDINEDTSLYDVGLDSIKAIKLSSSLSELVGAISLGEIFESASVRRLVQYYHELGMEKTSKSSHLRFMQSVIDQYQEELQSWGKAAPRPHKSKECILLTGATGSLGTALLEAFAISPQIDRVFVLLRGNADSLRQSMIERSMDFDIIAKALNIQFYPLDISDARLGLTQSDYDFLAAQVTTVVHAAWKMDFNRSVEEFEKDCLRSFMNMIRFCTTGPTKILSFVSSVAASMGETSHGVISEGPINHDLSFALATGYAQSKYIVERVAETASLEIGLPIKIFRLGQMYGHTRTGSWNFNEMFPIMLASSVQLRALPKFSGQRNVDWIPVDDAARTICDVLTAQSDGTIDSDATWSTHNVVNPTPISWDGLLQEIQAALHSSGMDTASPLDEVSMTAWTEMLQVAVKKEVEQGAENKFQIHGSKLLNFFMEMARSDYSITDSKSPITFDTSRTMETSPALRACKAVNRNLLQMCLESWKNKGLIDVHTVR